MGVGEDIFVEMRIALSRDCPLMRPHEWGTRHPAVNASEDYSPSATSLRALSGVAESHQPSFESRLSRAVARGAFYPRKGRAKPWRATAR
jgi:hypothetical protein